MSSKTIFPFMHNFPKYLNKSVAFTFVDQDKIKSENKVQIEINGDLFNCSLIKSTLNSWLDWSNVLTGFPTFQSMEIFLDLIGLDAIM